MLFRSSDYCHGNDPTVSECDPAINFDLWAETQAYEYVEIRDAKTRAFPFSLGPSAPGYGSLYIGSYDSSLVGTSEVFRAWFSAKPNGEVLNGASCEWYSSEPDGYLNWMFGQTRYDTSACDLGIDHRTLYLNFETRCSPHTSADLCTETRKPRRPYIFFVDRQPAN